MAVIWEVGYIEIIDQDCRAACWVSCSFWRVAGHNGRQAVFAGIAQGKPEA